MKQEDKPRSQPSRDRMTNAYPSRVGESDPASSRGALNVSGAPRIERTNPNFLRSQSPAFEDPESKVVSAKSSEAKVAVAGESAPQSAPVSTPMHPKEAETQERAPADAVVMAQRALDENMAVAGIASALAPDESGFRQRVQEANKVTAESIDELIEGLPFEAALPRKKSARRLREEESLPKRPALPSLTGQAPLITGTGDVGRALREQKSKSAAKSASLIPAGLSKGRTPYIGGLLLLGGLLVAAYFVARSTQSATSTAPAVATVQTPAAQTVNPVLAKVPPPTAAPELVPEDNAAHVAPGASAQEAAGDAVKGRAATGQAHKRVKNTRPGSANDEMTLDDSSGLDSAPGARSQGPKKATPAPTSATPPPDTGMLSP